MSDKKAGESSTASAIIDSRAVAREFSDLKFATDTHPPMFGGQAKEQVEQWLRRFDRIAAALEWDESKKLKQAPIYLDSFAANWFEKETSNGTNRTRFPTW